MHDEPDCEKADGPKRAQNEINAKVTGDRNSGHEGDLLKCRVGGNGGCKNRDDPEERLSMPSERDHHLTRIRSATAGEGARRKHERGWNHGKCDRRAARGSLHRLVR